MAGPFVAISLLGKFIKLIALSFYKQIDTYIELILLIAFVWGWANWSNMRKQQKALETERKKRLEEEANNRIISAQRDDLEYLVAERTAELTQQKEELQHALDELKTTQTQLIQREKMASLGELTAGIAHEIQNPLNFVNNFSEVSVELLDELADERQKDLTARDQGLEEDILADLRQNLEKINHHGRRADSIVKGMMEHSRTSNGQKRLTNFNALTDEYLKLAYHGLRAKDKTFNAQLVTNYDPTIGEINLVPQDIGRVLINLFSNAFYALQEKQRESTSPVVFQPVLRVTTQRENDKITLRIKDNGTGIPQDIINKIYQPFFTTKPTGQGTGLGLSLSYDIVTKGHGGDIKVESVEGWGTTFEILLPQV
jgi:signal transduction histidine kinase